MRVSISNLDISRVAMVFTKLQMHSVQRKRVVTDDTKRVCSKDEIFGEIIVKMLSKFPSSEEKCMLQLRMQKDIIQTICRCGNSIKTSPHCILGLIFHCYPSGRNLVNYNCSSTLPSPQESQLAYPQHILS